ncbi:unnamed protein product [Euphydryas editha]|uniref:Uncharacterized protein n=1 Tax=Euphydryas editha TaxID=104508 RepID=A0AAU9TKH5_EUPED|nr:unnamed protein product [Euphydryas editha]
MIEIDDEFNDPIKLFDLEPNSVFYCTVRKEVIIEDFNQDENTEYESILCSHKSNSSMLPVAFYDIDSNVDLLKRCRPLSIKLVDCNKFPWYYKRRSNLNKYNIYNSKSYSQEPDCIEIISSDESEYYETVIERTVSKDITDINNEFNKSRSINDTSILQNKSNNSHKKYEINSSKYNNDKNEKYDIMLERNNAEDDIDKNINRTHLVSDSIWISEKRPKKNKRRIDEGYDIRIKNNTDFKRSNEIVGLKVTQKNMTDTKLGKRRRDSQIYIQNDLEETYIDKINTYARLIDKAYKNLQTKEPLVCNTYIHTYDDAAKFSKDQNINKSKLLMTNKTETMKSKNDKYDSSMKVKDNSSILHNLRYEDEEKGDKSGNEVSNKKKTKRDFTKVSKLIHNNGSCSPFISYPSHMNKSNSPNKIKITPDTPLSSAFKKTIKDIRKECKRNVCTNQFYSANRVIPHYHNEITQRTKIIKSSVEPVNISKKSNEQEAMQIHNEEDTQENDCFKNQSLIKENRLIEDFSNTVNNNHKKSIANQIPFTNSLIPNMCTDSSITQFHFNQESHKGNMYKEKLNQRVGIPYDSVSSLEETNGSKCNSPVINRIPVILGQKPQSPCYKTTSTFPIQSIISNRGHFQSSNLNANSHDYNEIPVPYTQNFIYDSVYPNYDNNNFFNPDNNLSSTPTLQTPVDFYKYNPSLYSNRQALATTNRLPHHQIDNAQILNTTNINNPYINHNVNTLNIDYEKSLTSKFNKQLLATENLNQKESKIALSNQNNDTREASTSDNKYLSLKQLLKQTPLNVNKSISKNVEINQQIDKNYYNSIQLNKKNGSRTITNRNITLISDSNFKNDEEKVIAALVATGYMRQKAMKKEENNKSNIGGKVNVYGGKHSNITHSLERSLLNVNKPDIKNTENDRVGQNINSSFIGNVLDKSYSPPINEIPTHHKTFELQARVKLYDLERDAQVEPQRYVIGESTSIQNSRKRKLSNEERLLRKISISEYRQRQCSMKSNNLEDKNL